jgi:hypothetical protein
MKPLNKNALKEFLERFEYFKDGEFRNIEINSPTNIALTFTAQDSNRGFDWISIKLELDGVSDASLLENSELDHVDMSEGIDIRYNGTKFAFVINNSTFRVESSYIKYEEEKF